MKFRKEHFKHKLEKGKNAGKTFTLIGLPVVVAMIAIREDASPGTFCRKRTGENSYLYE